MAEHRTVTAAVEGSTPFDPPKIIVDCQLAIADWLFLGPPMFIETNLNPQIGNRQSPIVNVGSCGREVRHLAVNQADDGSSPFSSAMRQ